MGNAVLVKPLITEKALEDAKEANEYTFLAQTGATKPQIKEAVEETFGVHVKSVRTGAVRGKTKRVLRTKRYSKKPDYKKAIVKLVEKEKIELFETKEKK